MLLGLNPGPLTLEQSDVIKPYKFVKHSIFIKQIMIKKLNKNSLNLSFFFFHKLETTLVLST